MKLPEHKCSLSIVHNEHKDNRETVAEWLTFSGDRFNWKDEAAKQRAIDTDEVWSIQWYPNTPIGFIGVAAPTLDEALAFANSVEI